MGSKKLQVWLPIIFSLVLIVGMILGYQIRGDIKSDSFFNLSNPSSLQEVLHLIQDKYVDALPQDSINEVTITDLLSHLDPHSIYIPASDFREVNDELMGNFQGIGVEFQLFNDTVNIIRVLKNGPSEKAGLQIGDKIITANDTVQLAGKKLNAENIRKQLRGAAGSTVEITIVRDNIKKDVTIIRGSIPVSSIDAAYIIAPKIGYLRINKFAERTYEEFMQSMEMLQKQGMQKLVLDLRGNGGGLLNEAVAIADEFLDGDKLIVYTQGNKLARVDYRCKKEGIFEKGKLIVLVDETSASASEVLTGALQDWDRATIIGRRTFGKGLVQQQFQLSDGSALRLTVARYYTPLGRSIQKPYNKGKEKYEEELLNRFHDGEVIKGDTAKPIGKSFKTASGHIVYGGGGITPDIFIPFDTSKNSMPVINLFYKNTLNNFVYQLYIQNKQEFKDVNSVKTIDSLFNKNENNWLLLQKFAAKDSITLTNISLKEKEEVIERMKAIMARQILGPEGYFETLNYYDKAIQKSIELMK